MAAPWRHHVALSSPWRRHGGAMESPGTYLAMGLAVGLAVVFTVGLVADIAVADFAAGLIVSLAVGPCREHSREACRGIRWQLPRHMSARTTVARAAAAKFGLLIPFHLLFPPLHVLYPSYCSRNSDPGSHNRLSSPLPTKVRSLKFISRRLHSAQSSLVMPRRATKKHHNVHPCRKSRLVTKCTH